MLSFEAGPSSFTTGYSDTLHEERHTHFVGQFTTANFAWILKIYPRLESGAYGTTPVWTQMGQGSSLVLDWFGTKDGQTQTFHNGQ